MMIVGYNVRLFCMNIFLFITLVDGEIPEYIKICYRSDPNLDQCLINSIERLKPHLISGIPDLDIPPIDPIYLNNLTFLDGRESSGLSLTTRDITAVGAGDFRINKLHVADSRNLYTSEVFFPLAKVEGSYDIDGKLLGIYIKESGKFTAHFWNITGQVELHSQIINVDGVDYFNIKEIILTINFGKGNLKLYNVYGVDTALTNIVNAMINGNFNVLAKDMMPLIEKSLSTMFTTIGNKISMKYRIDELFPE